MYPAKFDYVVAASVQEAVEILGREQGEAKILAGGHSLLPLMKLRLAQPRVLVDIGRIPGLAYIRRDGDQVAIGAMATYRAIQRSEVVREHCSVLAEVAGLVGDPQVRARGTLAGALAHADPAADTPAAFLALGGVVRATGPAGERQIGADGFFLDLLTTTLDENEIITEVRLPARGPRSGAAYHKFDQPASHYALTGVCAAVTLAPDDSIQQVRIGITGVGPAAYRPARVEAALAGARPTEEAVRSAAEAAVEGVDVQGDIHASPEYRGHLARVLTRRAILDAVDRARVAH